MESFLVALKCVKSLVLDEEVELGGKPDTAHHPQWVVAEGDVWVEWGSDDTVLQVIQSVEGVNKFAKSLAIQA